MIIDLVCNFGKAKKLKWSGVDLTWIAIAVINALLSITASGVIIECREDKSSQQKTGEMVEEESRRAAKRR